MRGLFSTAILTLPVAAQAQPVSGLYFGAGAGLNWLRQSDLYLSGPMVTDYEATEAERKGAVEFSTGWVGLVSLGWGFGNGVRAEIEASYRQNDVDSMSGFPRYYEPPFRASGRASSYGMMANALYDFDLGPDVPLMPYIGLGAGYVWHRYDNVHLRDGNGDSLAIDGNEGRFAYQAIIGAALKLDDVLPGLALTAEYRFMGTLQPEINARDIYRGFVSTGTAEAENLNHSILIGIRYAFNATAPAPAPIVAQAATPAPARTFLVFFDFDRADLTDRARAIIAEAAQNAQRSGSARIEVAGHADRSGTPQYNQGLSERRAQVVAAELERRGVARSAMIIQAFGESRPLVPTADGVREPQNRRVEIVLR
jgi:outer membrane protein OmpA-like peptidoglycan-associated protein